ncbi:GNAT family N-acetyltransferase [Dellaglioa sp. P0083]|uniref:GNAT family N-acetyltransferase n=1 Tax=Dellaglioa kimchii TaxID=3344667 RepID=UPI0038D4AFC6
MDFQLNETDLRVYNVNDQLISRISFTMINANQTMVIEHTWVADDQRHQGLAKSSIDYLIKQVILNQQTILPLCPYTKFYFSEHPELSELIYTPK